MFSFYARIIPKLSFMRKGPIPLGKPHRCHICGGYVFYMALYLKATLAKNYRDRIPLSAFISFCLQILNCPPDVLDALENGEVTRLTPERLDVKPKKALAIRQEVLSNHLKIQ
jgi:hypothetical protein